MAMLKIIVIRANDGGTIVMNYYAFAITMEGFHPTHIHRILIMAKIVFILNLAIAQRF
jgi:hypothetical protein